MLIKKGTILVVKSIRKGQFTGIAGEDFDTEVCDFFPIRLYQEKPVIGMVNTWEVGEYVPCRKELCSITIKKED